MNPWNQAVANARDNLRVASNVLMIADPDYLTIRKACMGVVRELAGGGERQWTPAGMNGDNVEVDHLFEVRYCGKLFAVCVRQMNVLFPQAGFAPLLSDAVFAAEICNDNRNLYTIPRELHLFKTGYLNEGANSRDAAQIVVGGVQTAMQTALILYLNGGATQPTSMNVHFGQASFRDAVEAARADLPQMGQNSNTHDVFKHLFCEALLLTPFANAGWDVVFDALNPNPVNFQPNPQHQYTWYSA